MFLRRFRKPPSATPILQFHAALEKMNRAESMEALWDAAFQEAMLLTDAEAASLFLWDEEKEELVLKRGSGGSLPPLPEIRRRMNEGIFTPSLMVIPILLKGELKGLLSLTDKKSGKPFTRRDLEWTALLGHCLALTMEKNSLAAELKGHRDALEESRKGATHLEEKKRKLESELKVSQKMASIGKLAAGIAHELNNPLDGTLRYLHLSLSHLREGDTVREYLLEVKQGLDRMVNIVKNLLAFSRRQSIREKRVDLHEALNNVLSNLIDTFLPFRVDVIKAYHPNLPLLVDKGVDQIFTNIIKNALEAMPNGGILRIATMMNEDGITVRISDTGSGIPKEQKRFIFEPFFTTKEIDKGCGLGLSICYELMQAYEGRIEFESEEKRGTTFLLHFPLKVVARESQLAYAR